MTPCYQSFRPLVLLPFLWKRVYPWHNSRISFPCCTEYPFKYCRVPSILYKHIPLQLVPQVHYAEYLLQSHPTFGKWMLCTRCIMGWVILAAPQPSREDPSREDPIQEDPSYASIKSLLFPHAQAKYACLPVRFMGSILHWNQAKYARLPAPITRVPLHIETTSKHWH